LDAISISSGDVSKSEAEPVEGGVEPGATIDEEGCVGALMFLSELVEERPRRDGEPLRK
jgi:hypothetical protein